MADDIEHRHQHCCRCNTEDNETILAKARVETNNEEQAFLSMTSDRAVSSLEHMGAHRPAAEEYLTALFEKAKRAVAAPVMPRFP